MPSVADRLLAGGCVKLIEALHGETITVLSGVYAGQSFVGVKEVESDINLETDLGIDPRGKRVVRFRELAAPLLASQDVVQTDDGKKWNAVRMPGNNYLTIDFELKEFVAGKDT